MWIMGISTNWIVPRNVRSVAYPEFGNGVSQWVNIDPHREVECRGRIARLAAQTSVFRCGINASVCGKHASWALAGGCKSRYSYPLVGDDPPDPVAPDHQTRAKTQRSVGPLVEPINPSDAARHESNYARVVLKALVSNRDELTALHQQMTYSWRRPMHTTETTTNNERLPFTMVPDPVIDAGLTPQALALFVIIAKYADNTTREAYPSRNLLAEKMGMSKASSVDRYIRELVDSGFIEKTTKTQPNGALRNTYRIAAWNCQTRQQQSSTGDGGGPSQGTEVVLHGGHELDSPNYTLGTRHRNSSNEHVGPDRVVPISEGWHVNGLHVNKGAAIGLNVRAVGDVFKRWAIAEGIRSRDFDRRFGVLLDVIEQGHHPEDMGFAGISDYAGGDYHWYEHERFQATQ